MYMNWGERRKLTKYVHSCTSWCCNLTWRRISTTCVLSMWGDDRNCKYVFMFLLKYLARKELSNFFTSSLRTLLKGVWNCPAEFMEIPCKHDGYHLVLQWDLPSVWEMAKYYDLFLNYMSHEVLLEFCVYISVWYQNHRGKIVCVLMTKWPKYLLQIK